MSNQNEFQTGVEALAAQMQKTLQGIDGAVKDVLTGIENDTGLRKSK
jgi:hypothetical protein